MIELDNPPSHSVVFLKWLILNRVKFDMDTKEILGDMLLYSMGIIATNLIFMRSTTSTRRHIEETKHVNYGSP